MARSNPPLATTADGSALRRQVAQATRIVVKIGSRTLASDDQVYQRLAQSIAAARASRGGSKAVVLVSSGAIALGVQKLGYASRPEEMARLQAAAAAGQSVLMRKYEEAFAERGVPVAQVLLTHADLADRQRGNNARDALGALLDAGAVPILNENDSVAVEEIKFGDNDQLSAMVAPLVDADLLVLLSDVEGVLDGDGRRIAVVRDVKRDALPHVHAGKSAVGSGGMASKVEAARRATLAGAHVVVADARAEGILDSIFAGEDVGTLFVAAPDAARLSAERHWIAFTLRPKGEVVLERRAVDGVRAAGASVRAADVLGVRGDFRAGDAVRVLDPDGAEIGRGLARYGAMDAVTSAGKKAASSPEHAVLVHGDELVLS